MNKMRTQFMQAVSSSLGASIRRLSQAISGLSNRIRTNNTNAYLQLTPLSTPQEALTGKRRMMMNTNTTTKTILACLTFAAVSFVLTGNAVANPAPGTNDDLVNGEIYIPLQPSYSGVLGNPLGGGLYVGQQSDSVYLTASNPTSAGSVTFELVFDISSEIGPGEIVQPSTAVLLLNFTDMDFKLSGNSLRTLQETVTMSFRRDAGGAVSGTPLTLDETNYGLYSGGVFGETNNTTVAYEISLANDLNITQQDFDDMSDDHEFSLLVTLSAEVERIGNYNVSVRNSAENIENSFLFAAAVPEPATLALIAIGGGLIAVRRRRRS